MSVGVVSVVEAGVVTVVTQRTAACGKCKACMMGRDGTQSLRARNVCGAQVGDKVAIELAAGRFLLATTLAYLLPLFGLIDGAAAGYAMAASDGATALGAMAGLGLGVLCGVLVARRRAEKLLPRAVEILVD